MDAPGPASTLRLVVGAWPLAAAAALGAILVPMRDVSVPVAIWAGVVIAGAIVDYVIQRRLRWHGVVAAALAVTTVGLLGRGAWVLIPAALVLLLVDAEAIVSERRRRRTRA